MKRILACLIISFLCAAFLREKISLNTTTQNSKYQNLNAYKLGAAFGCSPNVAAIDFSDPGLSIPLLQGWGQYRMPVTHAPDSAHLYFQQGINMYYGFHIIEALASFEKAILFDSSFAMAYWGKALAYGPNINDLGYAASPDALLAVQKAKAFSSVCTPVEKALISAMDLRYVADTTISRTVLNQRYADAMQQIHQRYPESADAAALYADALMVQHPWDLYDRSYNPKPWTPEIVSILEKLVKKFPENPGANHYYIHAIEGSRHPEKALEVANRLGAFMPGVAHLVHMPSHIYIRSGYYKKGIAANEAAIKGYEDYRNKFPLVANGSFLYLMHNLHMKAACAAMDGKYSDALQFANETKNSVDTPFLNMEGYFGMYAQYLFLTPVFTQVRFGKWDVLLQMADVPSSWVYASSMQHFAKGMAYARRQQFDKANNALNKMLDSSHHPIMQDHPTAFNPGIAAVQVAHKILEGAIAEEQGNIAKAVATYQQAVNLEDGMLYNEPRDWTLPTRQYLGNALIKAGQYSAAAKIYKEDLAINPNNGWSLTGMATALKAQGKTKAGAKLQQQASKAFAGNDAVIVRSVF